MKPAPGEAWPEAMATVTACTYEMRAGRALAFGLPSGRHFRIVYNYWAGDRLETGQIFSEKAIPQGSVFPIRYDPAAPQRSRHGETEADAGRAPLLAVGVAGSVVLSLLWLLVLRGCR